MGGSQQHDASFMYVPMLQVQHKSIFSKEELDTNALKTLNSYKMSRSLIISNVQKLSQISIKMNSNINMQIRCIRYTIPPDFDHGMMRGDLYPHMDAHSEKMFTEMDKTKCEPLPHHRYEYLSPSQARVEKANKKVGRKARAKVKALLDMLDIKSMLRSL